MYKEMLLEYVEHSFLDGNIKEETYTAISNKLSEMSDLSCFRFIQEKKDKKWIQKAIKHPGSLHKALGVPQGEKIPASKLSVKPGDSPKMKKKKVLAKTLKGLHK